MDKLYFKGVNDKDFIVKVYEMENYDGFFVAESRPRKENTFEEDLDNVSLEYIIYEEDLKIFLVEQGYAALCQSCGKLCSLANAEINTSEFLDGQKINLCEDCWSFYTIDIEDNITNAVLAKELLQNKIVDILKKDDSELRKELQNLLKI